MILIKKSSFLLVMLVVLILAIGSVSASELNDSNSVNTILNSDEITLEDNSVESIGSAEQSNSVESIGSADQSNSDKSNNIGSSDIVDVNDIEDVKVVALKNNSTGDVNSSNQSSSSVNDTLVISPYSGFNSSSKVSISDIIKSSTSLKSYVLKNKKLPNTVTVGGVKCTVAQFSYLMSVAIKYLNAKKSTSTKITISEVTGSIIIASFVKNIDKANYLKLVNSVVSAGSKKKVLPSYLSYNSKKLSFDLYTFGFAKILDFYKSNKRLPYYCLFNSSVFDYEPTPTPSEYVTIKELINASKSVKSYVASNYALPNTVTVGNKKLTIAQFTYLESVAIKYLNAKKSISTKIKVLDNLTKSTTSDSVNVKINEVDYLKLVNTVINSGSKNKTLPSYLLFGNKKLSYKVYTYSFAKILAFYDSNKRLPNYCVFDSSVFTKNPSPSILIKKGINEYNTIKNLSVYLKASGHCALNSDIKSLAKSLTKNCKSTKEKVNAIFTYVRDKISYSFYYDSKKSASGALSSKSANCCDKSNLIVALCRASNIPARYSHAKCKFSSGLNVGHVWAQVLIGDIWYCADATSTRNSLGVIKNWNTGSFSGLKQYSLLPF